MYDFFNKNYTIMIEPFFEVYYWIKRDCDGQALNCYDYRKPEGYKVGLAYELSSFIRNELGIKGNGSSYYTGLGSVSFQIPCTLYIKFMGSTDDAICETSAHYSKIQKYFDMSLSNNGNGSRYGRAIIGANEIVRPKANLTISKVNSVNKNTIISSSATFEIYNSPNCSGKVVKTVKTSSGKVSVELDSGIYSVKEIGVPDGYEKPKDACVKKGIILNLGDDKTEIVYNEPNCNTRLKDLGNSPTKEKLYELFSKYYPSNTGLLNFKNPKCEKAPCEYTNQTKCLEGDFGDITFNQDNVSCFNEKINVDGKPGFCLVSFNLENKLGSTNFFAKSGQMAINRTLDYSLAAVGTINKKCLMLEGPSPKNTIGKYSDYVSNIQLDNLNLNVKIDLNKVSNFYDLEETNHVGNWYEYSKSVNYYLNEVYSSNIDGKISYKKCYNCRFLNYGVVSKFSDIGEKDIDFSIILTEKAKNSNLNWDADKNYTNKCNVTLTPELPCDPKKEKCDGLKIEFRLIDTSNPFPGKSGNGRNVGTNWKSKYLDLNNDGKVDTKDYTILDTELKKNTKDLIYDLNKDGKIDTKDKEFLNWAINNCGKGKKCEFSFSTLQITDLNNDGYIDSDDAIKCKTDFDIGILPYDYNKDGNRNDKDCNYLLSHILFPNKYKIGNNDNNNGNDSNNPYISYIMETTNNSYDKNKTGPIYRITLDTKTINKIREYNETRNYDDYTLECEEDGYNCKSTFLEQLGIKRLK